MTSTVVSVEGLTVVLGGRTVLDRADLEVPAGGFTALIGPNGAGKTTLMRVVLGLVRPASGTVRWPGGPVPVGYVPQHVHLDPSAPLRARDLVGLARPRGGGRAARRREVEEALAAAGASDLADRRVGRLSGGEQQRVMIAFALVRSPRLLVLDEPLASLDLAAAAGVVSLLGRLQQERGVAVLVSAHDVNPLMASLDRVAFLAGGRLAAGSPAEVIQPGVLSRLYRHPVEVHRAGGRVLVLGAPA